jgi:hypothetical protein
MSILSNWRKDSLVAATGISVVSWLAVPMPLMALPGDTGTELVRKWRSAPYVLPKPEVVRKMTDGYPDLGSNGTAAGGRLFFSAFFRNDGVSEVENIDYRPLSCDGDQCSGEVIFQKSGNKLGHLLIAEVFGPEVLDDFVRSEALRTIKDPGWGSGAVKVYYLGKRFNYSTWVASESRKIRAISHFTVHEKNDAKLSAIIRNDEICANPATRTDDLCLFP